MVSEGKHVIIWVAVTESKPSSRWFKAMYSSRDWLKDRLQDESAHVERTSKFSEAYVFDSFEEAHKVFDAPAIKKVFGGRAYIQYYTDKEYFKEVLSRP